jgi:hypothetical protein
MEYHGDRGGNIVQFERFHHDAAALSAGQAPYSLVLGVVTS